MVQTQAQRTLLKSLPELWSELSDPAALERHLHEISGEIRITKIEHDRTVCWEGERAEGEVELRQSGWGTRVSLTVREREQASEPAPARAQDADPEPELVALELSAEPEPTLTAPPPRRSFWERLTGRNRPSEAKAPAATAPTPPPQVAAEPSPQPAPDLPPDPAAAVEAGEHAAALLTGMLDNLGAAHHRPFSRD